jgi:hypothetical protein
MLKKCTLFQQRKPINGNIYKCSGPRICDRGQFRSLPIDSAIHTSIDPLRLMGRKEKREYHSVWLRSLCSLKNRQSFNLIFMTNNFQLTVA